MCLNCGCMRAHDDMGEPEINITYEDVKRAADANGMTIDATLAMIARTSDKIVATIRRSTATRRQVISADSTMTADRPSAPDGPQARHPNRRADRADPLSPNADIRLVRF